MKKSLKGLGLSLCTVLLLAGCSCNKDNDDSVKANINNGDTEVMAGLSSNATSIKLQEIYDDLKSSYGNGMSADKLIEFIASDILSDATWNTRYEEKVEEKLLALAKRTEYQVNGVFSEELLVKTLRSQLYTVTCDNNNYGPVYDNDNLLIEDYLLCDYTDYINKKIKLEALSEIINEKYIYDKVFVDKENILSTKQARVVEYISIDSGNDDAFDFITQTVKDMTDVEDPITDLSQIKENWINKLLEDIDAEYSKIGTSKDASGKILADYTGNFTHSKEEGLLLKQRKIYEGTYYDKVVITSDSKSILNQTLVERILSDNVLNEKSNKTIKIGDSYYLVSPLAGSNLVASDIRITDTANSKYYLVKVDVINKDSDDHMKYEAVKILATNTTLVSDSFNYYLEQKKDSISVHDEEVYSYLKTIYPDIFVD